MKLFLAFWAFLASVTALSIPTKYSIPLSVYDSTLLSLVNETFGSDIQKQFELFLKDDGPFTTSIISAAKTPKINNVENYAALFQAITSEHPKLETYGLAEVKVVSSGDSISQNLNIRLEKRGFRD